MSTCTFRSLVMNCVHPVLSRSIPLLLSKITSQGSLVRNSQSWSTCIQVRCQSIRPISSTAVVNRENDLQEAEQDTTEEINPIILRHPERDRRKVIPVETSIRYMKSAAFKEAYGDKPVWFYYRRNHKGQIPPQKTRKQCIRGDVIANGNPCPICRDEYLIVDYTNVDLLQQFISPITGNIYEYSKTGVCQRQHKNLLVALEKAKNLGLITFDVPHRSYDYSDYKIE